MFQHKLKGHKMEGSTLTERPPLALQLEEEPGEPGLGITAHSHRGRVRKSTVAASHFHYRVTSPGSSDIRASKSTGLIR